MGTSAPDLASTNPPDSLSYNNIYKKPDRTWLNYYPNMMTVKGYDHSISSLKKLVKSIPKDGHDPEAADLQDEYYQFLSQPSSSSSSPPSKQQAQINESLEFVNSEKSGSNLETSNDDVNKAESVND